MRLYNTARWKRMRKSQLRRHPFCQCPHHKGTRKVEATVVDHITPHRGDPALFFDCFNLQSLAKPCHDRYKQSQEKGGAGFDMGCDENGEPLNPEHAWFG